MTTKVKVAVWGWMLAACVVPLLVVLAMRAPHASAQTTSLLTIKQGDAITAEAIHDGVNMTGTGNTPSGFRVYIDGIKLGTDYAFTAWNPTTKEFSLRTLPINSTPGTHTLGVTAFNAGGESTPLTGTFTVAIPPPAPPTTPQNLKLSIIASATIKTDGTVDLTVNRVEGDLSNPTVAGAIRRFIAEGLYGYYRRGPDMLKVPGLPANQQALSLAVAP